MADRREPKCHGCGLHVDVCSFIKALATSVRKVTDGNFQIHLATATIVRFCETTREMPASLDREPAR